MSDKELTEIIKQAIADTGSARPADIGKVMQQVMPVVRGRADGGRVSTLVQQFLQ